MLGLSDVPFGESPSRETDTALTVGVGVVRSAR